MRKLRAFYPSEKIHEVYRHHYDPHQWDEHTERLEATASVAGRLATIQQLKTVSDLSRGNGYILSELCKLHHMQIIASMDITTDGPIEKNVEVIDPSDLFVCTETIEHLEAPWTVLEKIAKKTRWIVLSTPLDEKDDDNWEHYWSFTSTDVADMLRHARFDTLHCDVLMSDRWVYTYQVWTARSQVCDAT